jgi:hypothetical protein
MKIFEGLNNEQKFLILLSRISFSLAEESALLELANKDIDWYLLLCYAIKNKVLGFVYYNLDKYNLVDKLPKQIIRLIRFYYTGNDLRNKIYIREFKKLTNKFDEANISYAPLKGISLLSNLYKDMPGRSLNDIDCMIDYEQYKLVKQIMQSERYEQTEYDDTTKTQIPISRKKAVFWNLNMNNSYPFRKNIGDVFCERVNFDFCFGIDKNNRKIVTKMLKRMKEKNQLNSYDFFIHLCAHLYKEAVNDMWIWSGSDNNLVKFADVREFSIKYMAQDDFNMALEIAEAEGGNLLKAIHFTMFYLNEIYQDGYEQDIVCRCKIDDSEYLQYFNENIKFKKGFWERLFSYSNIEELQEMPKYLRLSKEEN